MIVGPLSFTLKEMGRPWGACNKEGTCCGLHGGVEDMVRQGCGKWKQGDLLGSVSSKTLPFTSQWRNNK